ncbi:hypothetical protein L228DRAFT_239887 [Xylona heveae TC161]|uniref:Uncharacterized protein n=1 Tax=Xylona heveae (strain CBS 132557 / TC161) TaxID=1328760 RepID=A0A165FHQ6_XYLHT|nr:hypothetical protein L228DRAFT_239887 [Xylona heveae TC161]KZF20992.1 hypothetical protein L228DRAFT_239887 [Xylona heveae TC161]
MRINLYVAFGQPRGRDPRHWMILAVPEGATQRCTYYHVTGGPTQGQSYELQIQANKRVNSFGIASKEYIGTINESDVNKLKSSAQRARLGRCQRWVVEVLRDLERKGLLGPGIAASYAARIEPSPKKQMQMYRGI